MDSRGASACDSHALATTCRIGSGRSHRENTLNGLDLWLMVVLSPLFSVGNSLKTRMIVSVPDAPLLRACSILRLRNFAHRGTDDLIVSPLHL